MSYSGIEIKYCYANLRHNSSVRNQGSCVQRGYVDGAM
jgi:hypothetical protein